MSVDKNTMKSDNLCIINPGLPTERKYGYKIEEDGLYFYEGKLVKQIISKALFLELIKAYKDEIKEVFKEYMISSITDKYSYNILGENCRNLEEATNTYSVKLASFIKSHNIKSEDILYKYIPYIIYYNKILDHVEVYKYHKLEEKMIINNLMDFSLFLENDEFKILYT